MRLINFGREIPIQIQFVLLEYTWRLDNVKFKNRQFKENQVYWWRYNLIFVSKHWFNRIRTTIPFIRDYLLKVIPETIPFHSEYSLMKQPKINAYTLHQSGTQITLQVINNVYELDITYTLDNSDYIHLSTDYTIVDTITLGSYTFSRVSNVDRSQLKHIKIIRQWTPSSGMISQNEKLICDHFISGGNGCALETLVLGFSTFYITNVDKLKNLTKLVLYAPVFQDLGQAIGFMNELEHVPGLHTLKLKSNGFIDSRVLPKTIPGIYIAQNRETELFEPLLKMKSLCNLHLNFYGQGLIPVFTPLIINYLKDPLNQLTRFDTNALSNELIMYMFKENTTLKKIFSNSFLIPHTNSALKTIKLNSHCIDLELLPLDSGLSRYQNLQSISLDMYDIITPLLLQYLEHSRTLQFLYIKVDDPIAVSDQHLTNIKQTLSLNQSLLHCEFTLYDSNSSWLSFIDYLLMEIFEKHPTLQSYLVDIRHLFGSLRFQYFQSDHFLYNSQNFLDFNKFYINAIRSKLPLPPI
ncbi:hypothetical protein DLAC_07768 [Tieghemostelium lacteum]|uniref:Uncharacterized protein n=1 Tax=Tieghemostelium lacteum TaxID=361077 RepID=A0A151ZAC1_TIELA|nr:hypothetical protein DLAC_07768 [Tieghemostelium lacteum]|eukprot:KYQ90897.1 hypothetical protein DLAC_07768 [Tieghemostelium lacteum]